MGSFPYFAISKMYGVDYAVVLELVEQLKPMLVNGKRIQVWSYSTDLPPDVAAAVRDAVVSEYRRRSEGDNNE